MPQKAFLLFFGCTLIMTALCQQSEYNQIQNRLDELEIIIKKTFRQTELEKNEASRNALVKKFVQLTDEQAELNTRLAVINISLIHEQLRSEMADSIRISLLFRLADYQKYRSLDSAILYANTILDLAKKNNLQNLEIEVPKLKGRIYEVNFHYDSALHYYRKVHDKEMSEKPGDFHYGSIINVCFFQGNYQYALQLCMEGLPLAEKKEDRKTEAYFHNIMGAVYNAQGHSAQAHKHYKTYVTIAKTLKDSAMLAHAYREWSQVYIDERKWDSALHYLMQSQELYSILNVREHLFSNQTSARNNTFYKISQVYKAKNDWAKALKYALRTVEMPRQTNRFELPLYYVNLGEIYYRSGNNKLAFENYHRGLTIAKEIRHAEDTRDANLALSKFYRDEKRFDSADFYLTHFVTLNDSVINVRTRQNIAFMQSQFDTERKDQQIKGQQARIKRQSLVRNIIIGSSILLLIILVLFYSRYQLKQKNKFQLQLNKQQNELMNTVITVQDKERKRIAEDLHDTLGSILSAAKLKLSAVADSGNGNGNPNYEDTMNLLDEAVNEMRSISHNLLPASLLRLGLVAGLKNLLDKISSRSALKVSFIAHGFTKRIDETIEVSIYRIILEAVNNIVKHAKAKNVTVQLMQYDTYINVLIEDDGVGFDKKAVLNNQGIGLNNIYSRVDYMKGKVDIDTKPRAGTVINIDIPYQTV